MERLQRLVLFFASRPDGERWKVSAQACAQRCRARDDSSLATTLVRAHVPAFPYQQKGEIP